MTVQHLGAMRERITIQQRSGAVNASGDVAYAWSDWKYLWARVRPMRSELSETGERLAAGNDYEITTRFIDGFSDTNRIVWRGKYLQMRGAINIDEHRRYMTITAAGLDADI